MATKHTANSLNEIDFRELVTYRLERWQTLAFEEISADRQGIDHGHRYFHTTDGDKVRSVTITRDQRFGCTCKQHETRVVTGEGEVCEHVEDAISFLEAVGFKKLSTRKMAGKVAV